MRWLFLTTRFPWPLTHGLFLRVYHLGRTLAGQGDAVSLLSRPGEPEALSAYRAAGVTVLTGPPGPAPRQGRPRRRLGPYVFDLDLADALAEQAGRFDAVALFGPAALQYAEEASAAPAVVAEMVDDAVLEEHRRLWRQLRPGPFLRRLAFLLAHGRYERQFLPPVRLVSFVSGTDARSFARRHRRAVVLDVPNGVDVDYFARPAARPVEPDEESVLFTGNLSFPPNQDAARLLIERVAPRVWAHRPDVRFVLAGANPPPSLARLDGARVAVPGFVEDLRPLLWGAGVVTLPMRMGTGIKNKLLEAWAAGAAVVATPRACQGVDARDGQNLLQARPNGEFAAAILRLLADSDLRRRLGQSGLATVRRDLTWPTVTARLRQALLA